MPSERAQRQIDRILDEAEKAVAEQRWSDVRDLAQHVLTIDPENDDGRQFLEMADRGLGISPSSRIDSPIAPAPPARPSPSSFANGRYQVRELLGEGGKKRVYRAHDTLLDRDVAFALIKTEGLDDAGRQRVRREARAMGRLGSHPNIVAVLDLGDESGQPYLVTELMSGGDLVALLASAPEHRLPLDQIISVGQQICRALEHAHARDIIHRDLKPGNVWLTDESTAKLGDFGLAVALDQTRHTQPGLMIGTVSYMAPEQAIGGPVDARADLYALGCMLYEIVCSRPPFIGEESVAIITQHLNSPPVAPSWHRPDCPPGLEALILRLLEKDPARRPQTAAEVLRALAGLAPPQSPRAQGEAPPVSLPPFHGGTEGGSGEPIADQNPLYRQTFVGRESEFRQLQQAYDAAISGQGGLVMVVGEPGIGKTSLCEQLATYVAVRGGKTLVGHCYEEGSLSLPYLPFIEAMRSYALAREPDGLRADLGTGAGEVGRIVSDVRERLQVELRPPGDPEDDRWRLLQAVVTFLRSASTAQPLLLVLEDLHDADRGTLDLLLHLARNLEGARLLVVGTYRDVEVDRAHPLSSALAELRRGAGFLRLPLRGLTVDEVHRMMCLIRGQEVSWGRAEAVHRQTEGNPLFVQEVLRYLVEEGLVVREGTRYVLTEAGAELGIPEGLRDVVGKRLSRLGEKANQVLSVASVIGREFRLDVLQQVAGLPEEEVIQSLEEAQARAVIEERSAAGGALAFRFTHAFFRQTLYEEIFAARRIRWHQQVARVLEEVHARRLEEHAAELAEHYAHSSDPADLTKAVQYAELAAQRAMAVYAYGEAVRHWEQALKAQDVLDQDDTPRRCDLLLALAEAMLPLEEPARVAESVAPEAFALAEAAHDSPRAARAAVTAAEALLRAGRGAPSPEFREWADRGEHHAQTGTTDRVYADIYRGLSEIGAGRPVAAHVYIRRAVEGALELGDNTAVFAAAGWAFARLQALRDRDLVARLAQEIVGRPRDRARAGDLGTCLYHAGAELLEHGDRDAAEAAWRELAEVAEHARDTTLKVLAAGMPIMAALLDGRIEEALSLCESSIATAQELGVRAAHLNSFELQLPFYLGRGSEQVLQAYEGVPPRVFLAARALVLAYLGRHEEARAIREQFGDIGSADDETSRTLLLALFEAAILGSDEATVRALAPRLAPLADQLALRQASTASVARLLGAASALRGKPDEARAYYQGAIEVCARVRFRPEIALTHLQLAELLLDHYPSERAEALEHLDFAIAELRDMKMQPMLERALRRKLQLQGVDAVSPSTSIAAVARAVAAEQPSLQAHAAPDGTVTLLFTDIEDSTSLTVKLGDQRWLEVLRAHHTLVRQQVQAHGGFEVKNQGDGFMLAFGSARRALDCAVAIQRAINMQPMDPPIRVRMGLHTGEALKDANDFHGRHVVLAARIANAAHGGEILVSGLLKELTESGGEARFDAGREIELKGLAGQHRVFAVRWD